MLNKVLFLDIETVSIVASYDQLSHTLQQLRDKKCAYMKESETMTPAELFSLKAGIYSEFGKIICIVCAYYSQSEHRLVTKSFSWDDEKQLLTDFLEVLSTLSSYVLCGHNIKEFDLPYICRRAMIHSLALPSLLEIRGKKPWEVSHIDTMELWSFGDRKNFTSLALLCEILAIETPKDDIDWSQVSRVYRQDHDLDRIVQYCTKDVIATSQVYERLHM